MQALLAQVFISIYDTNTSLKSRKYTVLLLLRSICISALHLVTKILGDQPEYKSWKLGLFKSQAFTFFLNMMQKDKLSS
jgi:hypothetical protein